jgi:hypothetical protein
MYRIIGADGQQYGPINAETVRRWIAENRANGQTLVQAEGTPDWKPLSTVAEFAADLKPSVPPLATLAPLGSPAITSPTGGTRQVALERVNMPGMWLMVVGILGIACSVLSLGFHIVTMTGAGFLARQHLPDPQLAALIRLLQGPVGIMSDLIGFGVSLLITFGAVQMRKLKSHGLALTISILAMLPCFSPCCILGLPFGIWALTVITKPEVKSQFS